MPNEIEMVPQTTNVVTMDVGGAQLVQGPRGEPGAVYTPTVSDDGVISWTNDGGLQNPAPVDITGPTGPQGPTGAKGDKGDKGDDGDRGPVFIPALDASGNLSWSNDGGLTNPATVNIRGPQGPQGPTGPAGSQGAQGPEGPQGPTGARGAITVGSTTRRPLIYVARRAQPERRGRMAQTARTARTVRMAGTMNPALMAPVISRGHPAKAVWPLLAQSTYAALKGRRARLAQTAHKGPKGRRGRPGRRATRVRASTLRASTTRLSSWRQVSPHQKSATTITLVRVSRITYIRGLMWTVRRNG